MRAPLRSLRSVTVFVVLTAGACTSGESPPAGKGGSGGGAGQSTPAGTGGNPMGSGGDTSLGGNLGAGGDVATGGEGGAPATGGAGGAPLGGTTGSGGASTTGVQLDPGTDGDGTFMESPPYDAAPEELGPINGAPKGTLIGPMIHTQTGTYTGWSTWKFTFWIYVPSQYKPGHPAALMVFQDGSLYTGLPDARTTFNVPQVFDNLIAEGAMPVTIAVLIQPGSNDGHLVGGGDGGRSRQYDTPNDQYGKFLLQEFLPAEVLGKYDIVTDADGWALGGHSSGGIASIMASWYYPDNFHKALTASPSFPNTGGKFPAEFLKVMPAKPLRIYHLAGTHDLGGFYDANNQAAKDFMMLGYHYRYRPGQDNHFPPLAASADFPDALRWLWRGYSAGQ
ncbi:MAG TPA: alpha/beta hydrolase-fold protein [Polyangia bacterium]|nr:alpha/beta hydrolase-fold protein [Polyangia bacterium]